MIYMALVNAIAAISVTGENKDWAYCTQFGPRSFMTIRKINNLLLFAL